MQPFILEVDASDQAVGGVLSQHNKDGHLHPVAYFSTALQISQKNWCATDKETFALIVAVRHWHVYLAGNKFTLPPDNNPLTHHREKQNSRGKIGRWLSKLEEYDYIIENIRGSDNVKADALSRSKAAPETQPPSEIDDKIYALFSAGKNFHTQLQVHNALQYTRDNTKLP